MRARSNTSAALKQIFETDETVRRICVTPDEANLIEILDRVLDNGIVLDPASRVMLIGAGLRGAKDRVVLESLNTYF